MMLVEMTPSLLQSYGTSSFWISCTQTTKELLSCNTVEFKIHHLICQLITTEAQAIKVLETAELGWNRTCQLIAVEL